MAQLQELLTLFRDVGVTLKLKEHSFLAEKIDYLRYVIDQDEWNYPKRQPQPLAN